jgi:hypothetical protein
MVLCAPLGRSAGDAGPEKPPTPRARAARHSDVLRPRRVFLLAAEELRRDLTLSFIFPPIFGRTLLRRRS